MLKPPVVDKVHSSSRDLENVTLCNIITGHKSRNGCCSTHRLSGLLKLCVPCHLVMLLSLCNALQLGIALFANQRECCCRRHQSYRPRPFEPRMQRITQWYAANTLAHANTAGDRDAKATVSKSRFVSPDFSVVLERISVGVQLYMQHLHAFGLLDWSPRFVQRELCTQHYAFKSAIAYTS